MMRPVKLPPGLEPSPTAGGKAAPNPLLPVIDRAHRSLQVALEELLRPGALGGRSGDGAGGRRHAAPSPIIPGCAIPTRPRKPTRRSATTAIIDHINTPSIPPHSGKYPVDEIGGIMAERMAA